MESEPGECSRDSEIGDGDICWCKSLQSIVRLLQPHHHNSILESSMENSIVDKKPRHKKDRLFVLQSDPLVYFNAKTKKYTADSRLNFKIQEELLVQALKDAHRIGGKIEVVVEPATKDELRAFLSQRYSQVLHFAGHGNENCLALENGKGERDILTCETLKKWIGISGEFLKLVVVTACNSGEIGQAFLKAGVPHVICCKLKESILDVAAFVFASDLNRSLACGISLKKAFEMAKQAVRVSSSFENAESEAEKFLLLSRPGADPEIKVFFTEEMVDLAPKDPLKSNLLPREPSDFLGRQTVMHDIITNWTKSDLHLLRVNGISGIGKTCVAAASCRYMTKRRRSIPMDFLYWLDPCRRPLPKDGNSVLDKLCEAFYDYVLVEKKVLSTDSQYNSIIQQLEDCLHNKQIYLVIDEGKTPNQPSRERLEHFASDLMKMDSEVKLMMISSDTIDKNNKAKKPKASFHGRKEASILIDRLEFYDTLKLFWCRLPESFKAGLSQEKFIHLMWPPKDYSYSQYDELWFDYLGGGIPNNILELAECMTADRMSLLKEWWQIRVEPFRPLPTLPRSPSDFFGRQTIKDDIIKCWGKTDLVRVHGRPGVGKTCVVAAACRHMIKRRRSYRMDFFYWLTPSCRPSSEEDKVLGWLCEAYYDCILREKNDLNKHLTYKSIMQELENLLHKKHMCLVIDEGEPHHQSSREVLEQFASDLMKMDSKVKLILISSDAVNNNNKKGDKPTTNFKGRNEDSIMIDKLDLDDTVKLLWSRLPESLKADYPQDEALHPPLLESLRPPVNYEHRKWDKLWKEHLGEGIPRNIIHVAERMTDDRMSLLMNWWTNNNNNAIIQNIPHRPDRALALLSKSILHFDQEWRRMPINGDPNIQVSYLAPKEPLKLVVVTACNSGEIGQAFLKAGVPHAVCCELDESLLDVTARWFASDLYRSLACGISLKKAFEMAKQTVRVSSSIEIAKLEAEKFLLLSRPDADPNVQMFFSENFFDLAPKDPLKINLLPRPPSTFIGRERDMYNIITRGEKSDLVRVTGISGVGKTSVVLAVCKYMIQRRQHFPMDFFYWLDPCLQSIPENGDGISVKLYSAYYDKVLGGGIDIGKDSSYNVTMQELKKALYKKKIYLVIDEEKTDNQNYKRNLAQFTCDMLLMRRDEVDVKVISISSCADHNDDKIRSHGLRVACFRVEPLDSESTVRLFRQQVPEHLANLIP